MRAIVIMIPILVTLLAIMTTDWQHPVAPWVVQKNSKNISEWYVIQCKFFLIPVGANVGAAVGQTLVVGSAPCEISLPTLLSQMIHVNALQ